ncbi:hypothetical protein C5167_049853 [Papaver somniferum]|uniref:Uncharacterized protein n=1 Tax=Papaver somniferum TaxID=3469 RepID=A0A4Y7KPQ6_PAPSO|nr:hypothetical protein C5167_049853 [Papaver somniferum]
MIKRWMGMSATTEKWNLDCTLFRYQILLNCFAHILMLKHADENPDLFKICSPRLLDFQIVGSKCWPLISRHMASASEETHIYAAHLHGSTTRNKHFIVCYEHIAEKGNECLQSISHHCTTSPFHYHLLLLWSANLVSNFKFTIRLGIHMSGK